MKLYIEDKADKKDFTFLKEISRRIKDNEFLNIQCFLYLSNILIDKSIGQEYDSNIIDLIKHQNISFFGPREKKDLEFKKLLLTKKIKNPEIRKQIFFDVANEIIKNKDISDILGNLQKEKRILDLWSQISQDEEEIKPLLKTYFNQPKMIKSEEITFQVATVHMEVLGLALSSDSSYARSQLNQFIKEYSSKAEEFKPLFETEKDYVKNIFFKEKSHKDIFMDIFDKTLAESSKRQKPSLKINKTNFDTAIKYAFLNHTIDSKEDKTRRNKI